ncbi:MAG: FtsX-like permease family protein [Phycisphaerae bacterium]
MASIALANLAHRRLRSLLSAAAVGIGVAMLLVMLGLSHGTLNEVAQRVMSVDAELVILPQHENVIFTGGAAFSEKIRPIIDRATLDGRPIVAAAIPVLFDTIRMGGQQQRLFGIDARDLAAFMGPRKALDGRLFEPRSRFVTAIDGLRNERGYYDATRVSDVLLDSACELVIDQRLAAVGGYRVGHEETILGRKFRIVGIVESGVAGRVFCPIQVLQHIKNSGLPWASMFFVRLAPGPAGAKNWADRCAAELARVTAARVELKTAYGDLLSESFAQVYMFVAIASAVSMSVCFLFILVTIYMNVLERTREIGILRALGATTGFLMRETLTEALLLCVAGTIGGIFLALGAKLGVEHFRPLLTVAIEPRFVLIALAIGIGGGVASALYPGYRAARLEPAAALNFD